MVPSLSQTRGNVLHELRIFSPSLAEMPSLRFGPSLIEFTSYPKSPKPSLSQAEPPTCAPSLASSSSSPVRFLPPTWDSPHNKSLQIRFFPSRHLSHIVDLLQYLHALCFLPTASWTIELVCKVSQRGTSHGFNPSLRKRSIKSSSARRVSKSILKLGWSFWGFFFSSPKLWKIFRIWNRVCARDLLS